jgi:hypothetical protein
MSTQHIISNQEIGLTECGLQVSYHEVSDPTPWAVGSDVAIWDNDEFLPGLTTCGACQQAYMG